MSKVVVYGQDRRLLDWLTARIAGATFEHGWAIGLEQDGELITAVGYTHYSITDIHMHVAATPGKRWATRDFLYRVFAYPFLQLGCRRVTGLVHEGNLTAQRFDEHLGFVREGLAREAAVDGGNFIMYGMLRRECRFLGDGHELR